MKKTKIETIQVEPKDLQKGDIYKTTKDEWILILSPIRTILHDHKIGYREISMENMQHTRTYFEEREDERFFDPKTKYRTVIRLTQR